MRLRWFTRPALVAAAIGALLLTGCSSYSSGTRESSAASVNCPEVLGSIIERIRAEDTSGAIDSEIDYLRSGNCATEYGVVVDYASARGQSCESLSPYISEAVMALLTEDGSCPGAPGEGVAAPSWADDPAGTPSLSDSQPGGGISWDEALSYAGTVQRVCGPFVGDGNPEDDVFLNLGIDYPSVDRFQIIIWDVGSIDPIPYGVTLCTSGQITVYDGVAQIEIEDPGLVEIYG